MPPVVSIILCTYNRAPLLRLALESLMRQSFERSAYEIVVVDNASTDHTCDVVKGIQRESSCPEIRLVVEPTQGLAHARNTGCRMAKGRYLAFIDDDCIASADWLQMLYDAYELVRPRPWSVGGLILPTCNGPRPVWFEDRYETDTWGNEPRFLKKGESFTGCNMSFRKDVIERLGGFEVALGMNGEMLGLAEETKLFRKLWSLEKDARCYYSPRALVYHAIDPYKMTVAYQLKRAFTAGRASYLLAQSQPIFRKWTMFFGTIALLVLQTVIAVTRIRPSRNWRNWAVEELRLVASHCGRLLAFCGLHVTFRQRRRLTLAQHSSYAS
jgi:glycosyltransferase involved in cell wall biosynthesis